MSRYNISNVRAAFVDTKTGALTKFGVDVLQRISDVLGLPSGDNVSDSASRDTYDSTSYAAAIDDTNKRIKDLSKYDYERPTNVKYISNKTVNGETYTANNNERIKVTGKSTIILPSSPITDSEVHFIKFDASRLILDGNGRKINDKDKWSYQKKLLSRQVVYFKESDEWVIM